MTWFICIYILLCVYNDPAGGIIAYFNTIHSIRMNKLNKRVKKTEQSFEEKKKGKIKSHLQSKNKINSSHFT